MFNSNGKASERIRIINSIESYRRIRNIRPISLDEYSRGKKIYLFASRTCLRHFTIRVKLLRILNYIPRYVRMYIHVE